MRGVCSGMLPPVWPSVATRTLQDAPGCPIGPCHGPEYPPALRRALDATERPVKGAHPSRMSLPCGSVRCPKAFTSQRLTWNEVGCPSCSTCRQTHCDDRCPHVTTWGITRLPGVAVGPLWGCMVAHSTTRVKDQLRPCDVHSGCKVRAKVRRVR